MPYIDSSSRKLLGYGSVQPRTAGELNYTLTNICIEFLQNHGEKYQTYNDIVGALECAKLEMYRRKIVPYEDIKIKSNGDVY